MWVGDHTASLDGGLVFLREIEVLRQRRIEMISLGHQVMSLNCVTRWWLSWKCFAVGLSGCLDISSSVSLEYMLRCWVVSIPLPCLRGYLP